MSRSTRKSRSFQIDLKIDIGKELRVLSREIFKGMPKGGAIQHKKKYDRRKNKAEWRKEK